MTKVEEISKIEEEIKRIFKMPIVPVFYLKRANNLIEEWKVLVNWKTDETPFLIESCSILDREPYYYKNGKKH